VSTRSTRSLAWLLWVLTLLGLAATGWLDHLLRLAGRPALTWSQEGASPPDLDPGSPTLATARYSPPPRPAAPARPGHPGEGADLAEGWDPRGQSPSGGW
jgi:hypothetical protein